MTDNHTSPAPLTLWPVILLGISGSAVFNLAPLYLSEANLRITLSNEQTGQLMGIEVLGIAAASFLTLFITAHSLTNDR